MSPPPEEQESTGQISLDTAQPLIVKKVKKGGHDHHGGAWKIAYADFVTAMMAFFLLLWLISAASPEQKKGLADYFSPPHVTATQSGAGGAMGGSEPANEGAQRAGTPAEVVASGVQDGTKKEPEGDDTEVSKASLTDLRSQEDLAFQSAAVSIRQAWRAMAEIAEVSDNLIVEASQDGLDIQIVDQEGSRMFQEGSKYPLEPTRRALAAIAPILQKLPNQLRISGHTKQGAAYPNPRYGPWELSSDRANAVRIILGEFGLSPDRIHSVVGRATEEPFFPNDPLLAANERIKITVLYSPPPLPAGAQP